MIRTPLGYKSAAPRQKSQSVRSPKEPEPTKKPPTAPNTQTAKTRKRGGGVGGGEKDAETSCRRQ